MWLLEPVPGSSKCQKSRKLGHSWFLSALFLFSSWSMKFPISFKLLNFCSLRETSLVAQLVKNSPAMRESRVWSLGWEDPLEKGIATHSSIRAWRIPTDRGICPLTKSQTWLSDFHFHCFSQGKCRYGEKANNILILLFMTTILTSRSSWKDLWDTLLLPTPTSPEVCKSHFENHCPIIYSCDH